MIKLKKNQLNKRHKKQPELTWVNPLSIILGLWDQDNLMKKKSIKFSTDLLLNDKIEKKIN
jgi:hypothetical protein